MFLKCLLDRLSINTKHPKSQIFQLQILPPKLSPRKASGHAKISPRELFEERGILYEERGILFEERGILFEERGILFEERGILFEERGIGWAPLEGMRVGNPG